MARTNRWAYAAFLGAAVIAVALGTAAGLPQTQVLAAAAAALVILVGAFLAVPEMSLLALLVIRPAVDAYVYVSFGGITLGQLWGFGLLAVICVYLVTHRDIRFPAALVALLGAWFALTLVRPQLSIALDEGLKLASWLLFAVASEHMARTRRGQEAILKAIWLSAFCVLVVVAIVAAQGNYGSAYYDYGDAAASARPHALMSLAVLAMPFVLAQIIANRWTRLSTVVGGLLSLSVALSFVRTGYLALAMVLAAYALAGMQARALRVRLSLAAMALAFGAVVYFNWDILVRRLSDLPLVSSLFNTASASGAEGSGRATFWKGLMAAGTDSPQHVLFGRGAGASRVLNAELYGAPIWSHNDFLEFFITGGVLLLAVYVAFLAWMLSTIIRLYNDSRQSRTVHLCSIVLAGAWVGYVVMAATNGITLTAWSLTMGAIVGMAQGMMYTPGHTALDTSAEADAPVRR